MAPPNHPPQDDRVSLSSRRALLGAGLAGGAAAVLAACDADDDPEPASTASTASTDTAATATSASPSAASFDPQDWESVRAQFNLDPALAQFAAFVLSPHTKVLDEAIAGYRDRLGTDTEQVLLRGHRPEQGVRVAAGGVRRRRSPASTPSPTAPPWASRPCTAACGCRRATRC